MDTAFEAVYDDDTTLVADEIASLDRDWHVITRMLPADWENKARQLGAVRRLRGFASVEALLRVLLIHLADGCSLRETAVRARAGDLAQVSDVALLKRLRQCGPWFQWMIQQMTASLSLAMDADDVLADKTVRLIDGSVVCEPGATGSTWRLHYALNLRTLGCDEVQVTEAHAGESLTRFSIRAGEVVMADRGFATRRGLRHVVRHGADALLRINLTNLPLEDAQGQPVDLLPALRPLAVGQAGDWPAWVRDEAGRIPVRVCAYKKTHAQTLAAQRILQREANKERRALKPETLEAAGYVIVLTTLMSPSAETVLALYRRRWQVELAFKRLKSLLQIGHLKKTDKAGAKAWLQGKLLVACLIETLIFMAERFSPWGYPTGRSVRVASPLALA